MLLFRSEEHVETWSLERGVPPGAMLSVQQLWALARSWYADRLDPTWRRRTAEEADAAFADVGLTGEFWRLRG
jgi:hypothetical protein